MNRTRKGADVSAARPFMRASVSALAVGPLSPDVISSMRSRA